MIFKSIRWRLQLWHGLILVLVLTGFGFTAYHVARDNQLHRIDQELGRQLMAAVRPRPPAGFLREGREAQGAGRGDRQPFELKAPGTGAAAGPPPSPPPPGREGRGPQRNPAEFLERIRDNIELADTWGTGQTNTYYFVLWQENGTLLAHSTDMPADIPAPANPSPATGLTNREFAGRPGPPEFGPGPEPFAARTRGIHREVYRFGPFGECVLVGRSIVAEISALHRMAFWLAVAGGTVLVFGLAGGWWMASRAIRPIDAISATAATISAGNLSQRINAKDTESELGRLAGVLNSTFSRLKAAFAQQARFTADASHELRTPIAVILNQAQTALARDRSSAEYREALAACQRAAQRMRALAESLLELARLDAGQPGLERESFDLSRVVRESVELVRPLAAERNVELRCELPETPCQGDPVRLGQVATNLLANAIQFNRSPGKVEIVSGTRDGSVFLEVADTGGGIPAEDLPHLFERFYRADKARSRAQGRTGLGLAICKAIVDAHGGTITVASEPGKGATFRVILPAPTGQGA